MAHPTSPIADVLALLLLLLWEGAAHAHTIGLSRGDYALRGRELEANLVFARAESPEALELTVDADGVACASHLRGSLPTESDGLRARVLFECPSVPRELTLRFGFLRALPPNHQHLVHVSGDASADAVVLSSQPELRVRVGASQVGFTAFVRMGVLHIVTGWDHLAFLLGLVVVGGRARSLVGAITAFTIAHSITLALSALDVVRASPALVEPAIALSVVWIGVENLRDPTARDRWRVTFPFGLVHGFGFAGALRDLEIPRARAPLALFGFNLGVELGQLAALTCALPLLYLLGRWAPFARWGVRGISLAVAIAGGAWFVLRVASDLR